jgi:hypothetical protein
LLAARYTRAQRHEGSLLYVHKKVAKGKTYYYFDLGKDELGNRILKRLPDIRSREFANAYKAAQGQRTKQGGAGVRKELRLACEALREVARVPVAGRQYQAALLAPPRLCQRELPQPAGTQRAAVDPDCRAGW